MLEQGMLRTLQGEQKLVTGMYTAKFGYEVLINSASQEDVWWWSKFWD